jgi:hypothetical protein
MRAFALAISFALAALALPSCDDNSTEHVSQYRLTPYSGNNQTERAGSTLPEPLVVLVTDLLNNPLPGIRVTFSVYDDPLGSVTPVNAATDQDGLASCTFELGPSVGLQRVKASASAEFLTLFSATATAPGCSEESAEKLCVWPLKHIFIATTSSSLLGSATGSVVIDFNPANGETGEVLETTDRIDGISFSARGELFVSMEDIIGKVESATPHDLTIYADANWPSTRFSLEPNPGGVLAALNPAAPHFIGCPGEMAELASSHMFATIRWENLAVDPVTRDIHMLTASGPTNYVLWRGLWDGRAVTVDSWESVANLYVGTAEPRGICADSSGTIYICFDGNDNWRRIVTVAADGTIDYELFDFYAYYGSNAQQAGRWGDIAYLDGKLYVIDRRNDRLVVISKHGTWLAEHKSDVFSMPLVESDHYAICASPNWLCGTR